MNTCCDPGECLAGRLRGRVGEQRRAGELYRVTPSGALTTVVLHDYQGASFRVGVYPALPDGEGGVLASWYCPTAFCATGTRSRHVSRALSVSSEIDAPIVPALSGAGTTAYGVGADGLARAVDMATGAVHQTFAAAGVPEALLLDGTVAVGTATGTALYDGGGQPIATGLPTLSSGIVFGETTVSAEANQLLARVTRTAALEQSAGRPVAQGNAGRTGGPPSSRNSMDEAALDSLRVGWPLSFTRRSFPEDENNREFGGYVCRFGGGIFAFRYFGSTMKAGTTSSFPFDFANQDQCEGLTKVAGIHTHPFSRPSAEMPSGWGSSSEYNSAQPPTPGSDLKLADQLPAIRFYLQSPSHILKYQGPNAKASVHKYDGVAKTWSPFPQAPPW